MILEKLRKQSIKSVLDVVLLAETKNGSMSGYDAVRYINELFGLVLSSGTIYAHLFALERAGLITSADCGKKRIYELTEKGEQALEMATETTLELLNVLNQLLTR